MRSHADARRELRRRRRVRVSVCVRAHGKPHILAFLFAFAYLRKPRSLVEHELWRAQPATLGKGERQIYNQLNVACNWGGEPATDRRGHRFIINIHYLPIRRHIETLERN